MAGEVGANLRERRGEAGAPRAELLTNATEDLAAFKTGLRAGVAELRAEVAELRADVRALHSKVDTMLLALLPAGNTAGR